MASLAELKRPETLVSATARHIGDAIVSGVYAPEASLPETFLAREIGVSRGTVREALRLLADDGLVEIVPHRGASVAPMTARAVREVFGIRALLESFAIRLAIEDDRITDAIDAIEGAYEEVERASDGQITTDYVDADRAFHEAITRLCDDTALLEMLDTLRPRVRRFIHWGKVHILPEARLDHAEIMAAIRQGDADAAAQSVRDHIVGAGGLLVARFEALGVDGTER